MWSWLISLWRRNPPPPLPTKCINAEITQVHPPSLAWNNYDCKFDLDGRVFDHQPFVFLFNASEIEFTLGNSIVKTLLVPAKTPDQRCRFITSFPKTVHYPAFFADTNSVRPVPIEGKRLAVDLINPENLGDDLDFSLKPGALMAIGCNFAKKGVFFSLSNPPAEEDISAAERRMREYYEGIWEIALAKYWGGSEIKYNDPEVIFAAKFLNKTVIPWERRKYNRRASDETSTQ